METLDLNYKKYTFAKLAFESMTAERGVGHARLVARLRVMPDRHYSAMKVNERPWLATFSGWLAVQNVQRHVADFAPLTLVWQHEYEGLPHDESLLLFATVSAQQLDLLNDLRPVGEEPFLFLLHLDPVVLGSFGAHHSPSGQLTYRMPASDWRRLLDGVEHVRYATIEVPIAGNSVPAPFRPAMEALSDARRHLDLRQWTDAIADSREVFERLGAVIGVVEPEVPWADFANAQQREAWSADQRMRAIRTMGRHATHLSHHGASARPEEARYVVSLAGIALRYYIDRLR